MRTNFLQMNIDTVKKYFRMIVAAALTAATISACGKSGTEENEVIDSTITIVSGKVLTVDAAAGEFEISYRISGESAYLDAEAVPDAEWLSPAGGAPEAKSDAPAVKSLSVAYAANGTSEDRTAKVFLKVRGAKPVGVSVIQKADPDFKVNSDMKFSLDVADVTATTALVTVAPTSESSYCYRIVTADEFNSFAEPSLFAADLAAKVVKAAQDYSEKYETPFSLSGYLYKGYRANTYKGLTPDTRFVLAAFPMSLSGDFSGNCTTLEFKTLPVTPSSSDFEVTLSGDKSSVTVVPVNLLTEYYIVLTGRSLWDECMTPEACVETYLDNYTPAYSYRGEQTVVTGLPEEGGDFLLMVFGWNSSTGKTSTGITYLLFHYDGK